MVDQRSLHRINQYFLSSPLFSSPLRSIPFSIISLLSSLHTHAHTHTHHSLGTIFNFLFGVFSSATHFYRLKATAKNQNGRSEKWQPIATGRSNFDDNNHFLLIELSSFLRFHFNSFNSLLTFLSLFFLLLFGSGGSASGREERRRRTRTTRNESNRREVD